MEPAAPVIRLRHRSAEGTVRDYDVREGFTVQPGADGRFRVSFTAPNFSPSAGRLLTAREAAVSRGPLLHPAVLPVWTSDPRPAPEPQGASPVLTIPLRRIFNVGHRGSPYRFPENTLASFRAALDEGANGLELDLCITRDDRLLVFHDPRPDAARLLFEDFPYELVSPVFERRWARILHPAGDGYVQTRRVVRWSRHTFDIARLTLARAREYYRYRRAGGEDHPLPELGEVLDFAAAEQVRLGMLFLDVKNPGWRGLRSRRRFLRYGSLIARALRARPGLPPVIVVANEREEVLEALREAFRREGEERCLFALDAAGSFLAMLGIKDDALQTAQRLGTQVVSVGARFRTGDEAEVAAATRARDAGAGIALVLHWTINDTAMMQSSLAAGVNGILTDRPDVLRRVLGEQGIVLAGGGVDYGREARTPAIT